jgi:hypothetical protein
VQIGVGEREFESGTGGRGTVHSDNHVVGEGCTPATGQPAHDNDGHVRMPDYLLNCVALPAGTDDQQVRLHRRIGERGTRFSNHDSKDTLLHGGTSGRRNGPVQHGSRSFK